MKILIKNTISLFLISVLSISCNDWLVVDPLDKVSEEDMFSTVKGYESVLNGVYRNMAESGLYGNFLSFGLINVMSYTYDVSASKVDVFKQAKEYSYNEAAFKNQSEQLWRIAFNCIANANNLIQNLEQESDDFFSEKLDQKNLMMGEAYAARAYVHFDLLRLYAPSPKLDDQDVYIPYVDYFPCKFAKRLTVKEMLDRVVGDLQVARRLLAWDTTSMGTANFINQWEMPKTGATVNNMFYGYRATRLNFYATTALLSRVLLYRDEKVYVDPGEEVGELSDKEMAYKMARMVISKTNYRYETQSQISNSDLSQRGTIKMKKELVFALWKESQKEDLANYYTSQSANYVLADYLGLYQKSGNVADYRNQYFVYKTKKGEYLTNRWWIQDRNQEDQIIPMIRLSELYYIAASAMFEKDKRTAVDLLRQARVKRGLMQTLDVNMSEENFTDYLIEDARKEFAGEGKMFFMYKRLNRKVIVKKGTEIELGGLFTLPVPESEFILN